MDQLRVAEQKKYDMLWKELPEYRKFSPADFLVPIFLDFFKEEVQRGHGVIDFGCGPGRSTFPLLNAGLHVYLVDFSDHCMDLEVFIHTVAPHSTVHFFQECLWSLSQAIKLAEWILCCDVLEHIPEEKIHCVLEAMALRMRKGGLFSICLCQDAFGTVVGEVLHLTVRPSTWWRERISLYFSICYDFINDDTNLVIAVKPIA